MFAEDLLNVEDGPREPFIRRSSISSAYDILPEELGRYAHTYIHTYIHIHTHTSSRSHTTYIISA